MSKKNLSQQDQKLLNARIHASIALQRLCIDAGNRTPGAFPNRDRAQEVVDAIVVCVLETLNTYMEEDKNAAATR